MISNNLISATWFLDGVRSLQDRITRTQKQISSGFRIQDAADSPGETATVVGLGTAISSLRRYVTNLGRVAAETTAADAGLSGSITLVDRARALATQAASTTTTAIDRQSIAIEVANIQQQLVGIANTSVEGRFIFGGDQDQHAPYGYNASASRGVDKLTTQTSTRLIQDPSGLQVFSADTAADIFDAEDGTGAATSSNVFGALQALVTALQSNDPAAAAASLTQLRAAGDLLNQKQAGYGAAAKRIADETTSTGNLLTSLQTRLSEIRDTDIVQASTELALENTAQSAMFSAQAAVPRKSLFDYLG